MTRRLFIAIPLPAPIVADLGQICAELKNDCPSTRWTRPENLHLTVLFLGDVNGGQYERIASQLADAVDHIEAPALMTVGIGPGPPRRPTMLWLNFRPSVGFTALVGAVRTAMHDIVTLKSAPMTVMPHVTLARFRAEPPVSCQKQAKGIEYRQGFESERCILFESQLSSAGPTYTELQSFRFGGQ